MAKTFKTEFILESSLKGAMVNQVAKAEKQVQGFGRKAEQSFGKAEAGARRTGSVMGRVFDRAGKKYERLSKRLDSSRHFQSITKRVIRYGAAVERLKAKQASGARLTEKQTRALWIAEQRYNSARRAAQKYGINLSKVGREHDRFTRQIHKTEQALDRMQRRQRSRSASAGVGAGLGGIMAGAGGAYAASRPIVTFASFEQAMQDVKAVARMTGKENEKAFQELKERALELGSTTTFTASQAAEGMKYLAMAGFKPDQIKTAIGDVLAMAEAGGTDLAMASDISSNILSGFGLQADQMGRVADILTATFTSSNTDLEMLGETMKYVAPVARSAGMSLEETAAMAGLLGNAGIQASMGGTTLRNMLSRLAAPATEGAESLKALGVVTKDQYGNLRKTTDILNDIFKASKNLGSAEKLGHFKNIFGERAAPGLTKLVEDAGSDFMDKYIDSIRHSDKISQKIAKERRDSLTGDVKALGSALEGLQVVAGGSISGDLRAVTQSITGVIQGLTKWSKEHPSWTKALTVTAGAIAGLGAAAVAGRMLGSVLRLPRLGGLGGGLIRKATGGKFGGRGTPVYVTNMEGLGGSTAAALGPKLAGSTRLLARATTLVGRVAGFAGPLGLVAGAIMYARSKVTDEQKKEFTEAAAKVPEIKKEAVERYSGHERGLAQMALDRSKNYSDGSAFVGVAEQPRPQEKPKPVSQMSAMDFRTMGASGFQVNITQNNQFGPEISAETKAALDSEFSPALKEAVLRSINQAYAHERRMRGL